MPREIYHFNHHHMKKLKVLNLYAGIGGNRKHWQNVDVTAVEYNEEIAAIYRDHYPDDTVVVGDAHAYLLNHYREFDFIWSSPPCPTHSRARYWNSKGGGCSLMFPDLTLYEEIIFLQHYAECTWTVENVIPFYEPLIKPSVELQRHLFWANFPLRPRKFLKDETVLNVTANTIHFGYDLSQYKTTHRKDQILRNMVNPDVGAYILNAALGKIDQQQTALNQLSIF